MYYGLNSIKQGFEIINDVVNNLGGGSSCKMQMVGTACAESQFGHYPDDNPNILGVGWMQHDQINLTDIKLNGQKKHFDIVNKVWGYDIENILLEDLAFDPVLSAICCRLSYKRKVEIIPDGLIDQANYWVKNYNSGGEGTESHYIDSVVNLIIKMFP